MSQEVKTQQGDVAVNTQPKLATVVSKGPKIMKTKVLGKVEWFNVDDGYGFIKRNDTAEDVFFHFTGIKKSDDGQYVCRVESGQKVQFDIIKGKKGPKAVNITRPGAVIIQGTERYDVKPKENRMKEVVKVSTGTMTTTDLSQPHLDEIVKVKEERKHLKEEMQALKNTIEKERTALREHLEKDLQAKEAGFQQKLEAQKSDCRNAVREKEAQLQKQLETQKDRFKKEKESKTDKSWVYIFGGVCLVAGFLSAKCLTD